MELELKYLTLYLPYKLKCSVNSNMFPNPTLTGINGIFAYLNYCGSNLSFEYDLIKPILRTLSDLTKDEYNFMYENETDYDSICDWIKLDSESRLKSKLSFEFWNELFNYHFDVFGLIKAGLAIDINTLNQ